MATQNQAKAADLLKMLQESGVATLAGELEEIIAEAWYEGTESGADNGVMPPTVNPYRGLVR